MSKFIKLSDFYNPSNKEILSTKDIFRIEVYVGHVKGSKEEVTVVEGFWLFKKKVKKMKYKYVKVIGSEIFFRDGDSSFVAETVDEIYAILEGKCNTQ